MTSYKHPNGLTLETPSALSVQQTESGFIAYPPGNKEVRSPTEIAIELRKGAPPAGRSWLERRMPGRAVNYRIDIEAGGSGGYEHTLRAWEKIPSGYLWLEQTLQVEPPKAADFNTAWQIFESAKVQ